MNNDIVQLTDKSGNNIYPIAGGATQDSISKTMLAEGVFEGPELFPSPNEAYVRTENIVDGAVTSDKIDWTTLPKGFVNYTPTSSITLSADSTNIDNNVSITMDTHGGDLLVSLSIVSSHAQNSQYSFSLVADGTSEGGVYSRNNTSANSNYGFRKYTGIVPGTHTFTIGCWVNGSNVTIPAYNSIQLSIEEIPTTQ